MVPTITRASPVLLSVDHVRRGDNVGPREMSAAQMVADRFTISTESLVASCPDACASTSGATSTSETSVIVVQRTAGASVERDPGNVLHLAVASGTG